MTKTKKRAEERLHRERSLLVMKKHTGGITLEEQERLDQLTAEVERLRAAELEPVFEALDSLIPK